MQYRIDKKSGQKLSVLGLGCMRFPRSLGAIDMKKAESIIMTSIEQGINYFDTAWMYPGSEEALGTVLEKNRSRNKIYIATKLPSMMVKKTEDLDRFFSEELNHLRTDHVDYYLIHNLPDFISWEYLVKLGIEPWIAAKKKNGQIKQIGFSFHGTAGEFLKILAAYPWEFTQIQYNYSDENYQAGVRGLKKAAETMPVIIMEPLLGGKLAGNLPPEAQNIFRTADRHDDSPAAWGLRWVWNQSEAAVVLSGMTTPAQVIENAALADACPAGSLTAEELEIYGRVREVFNKAYKIHCTGCAYCMPCPREINIAGCFAAYNTSYSMGWSAGIKQYIMNTGIVSVKRSGPVNCTSCGSCQSRCPQNIPIIENLKQVRRRMEPLPVRAIIKAARAIMGRKMPRLD
ncbi:MAG: aldo/keto reductase [Treponema sp.]|nr:aldo/keto reductase [Treponema sp.]